MVKSCASKSRTSYFRFARFNTSSLYYLRAWHRLGVRRHKKSVSEASREVGWGAERAADLPHHFPSADYQPDRLARRLVLFFFFCAFYLDFQKSPSSDYSVGCHLLPTVIIIGEGTFLSMAPAGTYNEFNRARFNLCN